MSIETNVAIRKANVMDTPVAVIPAPAPAEERSNMRRFLAERGVVIMKETRTVATIQTAYGAPLEVAGQVLVVVKGSERRVSVGVKFDQAETDSTLGSSAFIDSDEIDEFLGAVNFIITSASHMVHDRRDYTEVTYSTRDEITIGFYQDDQKQQAFVRLGAGSPLMFFRVDVLKTLHASVVKGSGHADERRRAWESQ